MSLNPFLLSFVLTFLSDLLCSVEMIKFSTLQLPHRCGYERLIDDRFGTEVRMTLRHGR
jgi:hypothetical protein